MKKTLLISIFVTTLFSCNENFHISAKNSAVEVNCNIAPDIYDDSCDFDGDGVLNVDDIDSDNDGILDRDEIDNCSGSDFLSVGAVDNGANSVEFRSAIDSNYLVSISLGSGISNIGNFVPSNIEVTRQMQYSTNSADLTYSIERLAPGSSGLSMDFIWRASIYTLQTNFSSFHVNFDQTKFDIQYIVVNSDRVATLSDGDFINAGVSYNLANSNTPFQHTSNPFLLRITSKADIVSGETNLFDINQSWNALMNREQTSLKISCQNISDSSIDSDGDSIPNKFDLDSDGDGCFDSLEANHGQFIDANGVLSGPFGLNGLDNTLDNSGDDNLSTDVNYGLLETRPALYDFLSTGTFSAPGC